MAELELARLHEDGEHLVLRAPDGTEHALPITEALRAAVRRDRPRAEALRAQATLRPRDLQARLRAGATVEELAAESGLPADHVQRYEWPVATERQHAIDQVRAHRLDGDGEVRTLGEAADARLGARGVTPGDAHWSARREGSAPWVVEVRFAAGDRDRSARWTYDPKGRAVTPLDDEARWLGQPDDPLSPEVLGVPSGPGASAPPRPSARPAADDSTALLLDDLAGRRGRRPAGRGRPLERPADEWRDEPGMLPLGTVPAPDGGPAPEAPPPETAPRAHPDTRPGTPSDTPGTGAPPDGGARRGEQGGTSTEPDHDAAPEPAPHASVVDLGARRAGARPAVPSARAAHPSGTRRPSPADDDDSTAAGGAGRPDVADHETPAPSAGPTPQPGPQPSSPQPPKPTARRSGRKGRPQVPSWDEIVFGGGRPSS